MHKWALWEKLTYLFVCWRTSYCASEELFANRFVAEAVHGRHDPKPLGKAAVPSPLSATTPCRLQQHQQTNTQERCGKRRDLPQSRRSRALHAYAL